MGKGLFSEIDREFMEEYKFLKMGFFRTPRKGSLIK